MHERREKGKAVPGEASTRASLGLLGEEKESTNKRSFS